MSSQSNFLNREGKATMRTVQYTAWAILYRNNNGSPNGQKSVFALVGVSLNNSESQNQGQDPSKCMEGFGTYDS